MLTMAQVQASLEERPLTLRFGRLKEVPPEQKSIGSIKLYAMEINVSMAPLVQRSNHGYPFLYRPKNRMEGSHRKVQM